MKALRQLCVTTMALVVLSANTHAADTLKWDAEKDRVDADIAQWNLQTLLKRISKAAGWEVYVEPGANHQVSVKFSNVSVGDALPKLLGKLNYAVLPQTNAASKFYVFQTTAGNATLRISEEQPKNSEPKTESRHLIPNELIVTLDPNSDLTIQRLAEILGATIVGRLDELNTYLLRFETEADALEARAKLKGNDSIASIDSNYSFDPPPPGSNVAFSSSQAFNLRPTAKGDPNNLIVGLIDSAVHGLDPSMQAFVLPQLSTGDKASTDGPLTHGTSMTQAMLQAMALATSDRGAPSNVRIQPVDVYGNRGNTTTFDVAHGIYLAINNGCMVVNLSLGSSGDSTFLHNMIRDSSQQGVIFFASAGNEPVTTPVFPAAYPEVVAVTAGDRSRNLAEYANRGSFVDVIGPGGTLVQYNNQNYFVGGTSVASAYVAGTAAGTAGSAQRDLRGIEALIRNSLAFRPPQ
jgi:hypothetical protein